MKRGSSSPARRWRRGDRDAAADALARNHQPRPRMERGRGAQAVPPDARSAGPRRPVVERAAPPAVGGAVHMSRSRPRCRSSRWPARSCSRARSCRCTFSSRAIARWCATRSTAPGRIAMIQPHRLDDDNRRRSTRVGCVGEIVGVEELDDGRFNIVLLGTNRFRLIAKRELDAAYRCAEVDVDAFDDGEPEPLSLVQRAEVEREARRLGDALGLAVDWEAVGRLDDEMLVNAIAQVAPFDVGAKQALLEAADAGRPRRPAGPADAVPAPGGHRRRRDRADAPVPRSNCRHLDRQAAEQQRQVAAGAARFAHQPVPQRARCGRSGPCRSGGPPTRSCRGCRRSASGCRSRRRPQACRASASAGSGRAIARSPRSSPSRAPSTSTWASAAASRKPRLRPCPAIGWMRVRRIADQRQPLVGDLRRMVEAERIGRARREHRDLAEEAAHRRLGLGGEIRRRSATASPRRRRPAPTRRSPSGGRPSSSFIGSSANGPPDRKFHRRHGRAAARGEAPRRSPDDRISSARRGSRPPRALRELRPSAATSSGALSMRPSSSATATP